MLPYLLFVAAGVAFCGWLLLRHSRQTALAIGRVRRARSRSSGGFLPRRLTVQLRREERRQQPWEGLN